MPPGWETHTDPWPNTAYAESRWLSSCCGRDSHGTLLKVGGHIIQRTGKNVKHDKILLPTDP